MSTPVVTPPVDGGLPPAPPKPQAPDPALARLEQQLNQQGKLMADLMRKVGGSEPPPAGGEPPKNKADLDKEFFKSPVESTAKIAQSVGEALMQRQMQEMGGQFETLKQIARDKAREDDPELFDKYALEIENKMTGLQPNLLTNIHVWKSAFNVVKGEHLSEVLNERREKENRAPAVHISHEGGPAPSRVSPPAPASAKLSEDEQRVARQLGISNEQYQAGKDHIAGQNDRGKSSWDGHITFDSREKRKIEREQRRNRKPAA